MSKLFQALLIFLIGILVASQGIDPIQRDGLADGLKLVAAESASNSTSDPIPVSEPAVDPVVDSAPTDSNATSDSPPTEPATSDPSSPASNTTDSNTTDPAPSDPNSNTTDSNTTDALPTDPSTSDPNTTDSNSTEPVVTNPILTCPKYTCSRTRGATCVNQTADGWQISKCNRGSECTFSFSNISNAVCKQEIETEEPEEICYSAYLLPGANCTASDYCQAGTYCSQVTSTCLNRTALGGNCSEAFECASGSVCNNGTCIAQFSIAAGNQSDSAIACSSGIVLNGVCQPAELTNGTIPKVCTSNNDCLATDGVTAGACQCGANVNGTAYCKAHRSDSLSLKQLAAVYNGNYEEIAYATYKLTYFHIVKGEIVKEAVEDCLDEALEIEAFEDIEEYYELCSPACAVNGCPTELGF